MLRKWRRGLGRNAGSEKLPSKGKTNTMNNQKKSEKWFNLKIIALTILIFILIASMLLAAGELTGIDALPKWLLPYIGGALIGYVIIGSFTLFYIGSQAILNGKGQ